MVNKKTFISNVVKEIKSSNTSLFLGAGVSKGAGFVGWKSLLSDIASELGLKIEKEHDLISIAQYYTNKQKSRQKINQKIIDEFGQNARRNELLSLLCQLPINSIWTTNYDHLIENEYKILNKILDVKIREQDFSISKHNKDSTLYKLHGDISQPNETVITRDDYEQFESNKELFIKYLISELVTHTFIFIGYSFNDPNLNHILSKVRRKLKDCQRTHYFIVKKEKKSYEKLRQRLKIEDLENYGVHTLEIKDFDELVNIFTEIRNGVYSNNVFISGSAVEYDDYDKPEVAKQFITNLAETLIQNDFTLVNGFGIGVGEYIVQGIVRGLSIKNNIPDNPFILKVFPQKIDNLNDKSKMWTSLREYMITQSRTAIFMFGNKMSDKGIVLASGMEEEFKLALKHKLQIILIKSTGYITVKFAESYTELEEDKKNITIISDNHPTDIIESIIKKLKSIRG